MQMQGSPNLRQLVLSPVSACPKLTTLNISHCIGLRYVLVQSSSLQTIDLSNCPELTKARPPTFLHHRSCRRYCSPGRCSYDLPELLFGAFALPPLWG